MYSEALRELDHNTEVYMVEEERRKVATLTKELGDARQELGDVKQELGDTKQNLDKANSRIDYMQSLLRQHNIPFEN